MEPTELDLATLTTLAGTGTVKRVLDRMAEAGHPGVRASYGYVFQRLLADEPTIGELARSLRITQQGASKQVRELESLGLVERRPASGDARVRVVRLTERGRDAVEAGRRARAEIEEQVVERVGAADVRTARAVLTALVELTGLGADVRGRSVPMPADEPTGDPG